MQLLTRNIFAEYITFLQLVKKKKKKKKEKKKKKKKDKISWAFKEEEKKITSTERVGCFDSNFVTDKWKELCDKEFFKDSEAVCRYFVNA